MLEKAGVERRRYSSRGAGRVRRAEIEFSKGRNALEQLGEGGPVRCEEAEIPCQHEGIDYGQRKTRASTSVSMKRRARRRTGVHFIGGFIADDAENLEPDPIASLAVYLHDPLLHRLEASRQMGLQLGQDEGDRFGSGPEVDHCQASLHQLLQCRW